MFCYSGAEYREYSPSVGDWEKFIHKLRNVSLSQLRGRIGKSLYIVPWGSVIGELGGTLERLVRQQKVPETLKFIISFPMTWLFVIIETRGFGLHFETIICYS